MDDLDPGCRLHRGRPLTVGNVKVRLERYDGEAGPGEVQVALLGPLDMSFTPAAARILALLLGVAADEGEQR